MSRFLADVEIIVRFARQSLQMDIISGFYPGADGKEHQVTVSSPTGGGSYHVYIDHFYFGQVVPSPDGWVPYIEGYVLNSDDIGAIVDLIEEVDPIASQLP